MKAMSKGLLALFLVSALLVAVSQLKGASEGRALSIALLTVAVPLAIYAFAWLVRKPPS